jgi:hypothetical protein
MDILNEQLFAYPPNPNNCDSESEISENEEHINYLKKMNEKRKRKKDFTFDDWNLAYCDELWHLWCIITPFQEIGILDRMEFHQFCSMCYENSTKKVS